MWYTHTLQGYINQLYKISSGMVLNVSKYIINEIESWLFYTILISCTRIIIKVVLNKKSYKKVIDSSIIQ